MKHRAILVDATVYTLASYAALPLTFIFGLIIKRELGPYLVGVAATLAMVGKYAMNANCGTLSAAERELPICAGAGERERLEKIRQNAFCIVVVTAVLSSATVAAFAWWFRAQLGRPLFVGLMVYAAWLLLLDWYNYNVTILRTTKRFVLLGGTQAGVALVTSALSLVGAIAYGFDGFLAGIFAAMLLQAAFLALVNGRMPRLEIQWEMVKHLFHDGLPFLLLLVAGIGLLTVDNLIVLKLLGVEALGLYSIALVASTLIDTSGTSMANVLYPRMLEDYGRSGSAEGIQRYLRRPNLAMCWTAPVIIGALYFLIPPVVACYLPRFLPGLPAFRIVVIGSYFLTATKLARCVHLSLNRILRLSCLTFVTILLTVVAAALAHRWGWGLGGVAAATALGYFGFFALITVDALRLVEAQREILRWLARLTLPFVVTVALLLVIDLVPTPAAIGTVRLFAYAALKLLAFLIGYTVYVLLADRKTGVVAEIAAPLWARVRRRSDAVGARAV